MNSFEMSALAQISTMTIYVVASCGKLQLQTINYYRLLCSNLTQNTLHVVFSIRIILVYLSAARAAILGHVAQRDVVLSHHRVSKILSIDKSVLYKLTHQGRHVWTKKRPEILQKFQHFRLPSILPINMVKKFVENKATL